MSSSCKRNLRFCSMKDQISQLLMGIWQRWLARARLWAYHSISFAIPTDWSHYLLVATGKFIGQSTWNGPFSIAMLVYQRVPTNVCPLKSPGGLLFLHVLNLLTQISIALKYLPLWLHTETPKRLDTKNRHCTLYTIVFLFDTCATSTGGFFWHDSMIPLRLLRYEC